MNVKELVDGSQELILDETIDNDTLYNVKDQFPVISATNAQMANFSFGFFKNGQFILCTDNGTYQKDYIYKFNGYGFVPAGLIFTAGSLNRISALETNKENASNKSTTLDASSTDIQYPTSKTVYDFITTGYALKSSVAIEEV